MQDRIRTRGFTLLEVIVAVAIVAILAAIAYPSYQSSVRKSRRSDAEGALVGLSNAMERQFTVNSTYAGNAAGGADTGAPTIYPPQSPIDGSTKYYGLTINAATASSYTLRATPIGGQVGDGYLELDNTGARRWDKNNDGDTADTGETNWEK